MSDPTFTWGLVQYIEEIVYYLNEKIDIATKIYYD
jgi:hypothetical protein